MTFDELISKRWKEAEERNDMRCWRALAEIMAMECLRLEVNEEPVPMELRLKADEAYQHYLDLHPRRED